RAMNFSMVGLPWSVGAPAPAPSVPSARAPRAIPPIAVRRANRSIVISDLNDQFEEYTILQPITGRADVQNLVRFGTRLRKRDRTRPRLPSRQSQIRVALRVVR